MSTKIKRFSIIDNDNQKGLTKCDTTQECYEFLKKFSIAELSGIIICCNVDDIDVSAAEFLDAFNRGETPEDLQFF